MLLKLHFQWKISIQRWILSEPFVSKIRALFLDFQNRTEEAFPHPSSCAPVFLILKWYFNLQGHFVLQAYN